ncbi:hypothetical protein B0T19DRAFT_374231 [Cercophora scortea]|uniref:UBC core domain-containing protein n=1 Tax=Cercophora scortea TaxID=314031 RepID=A0AAE0I955_9PEZI|nr:hypothetical protein B0T19DRAFT_374231 [Cercophora scortea]
MTFKKFRSDISAAAARAAEGKICNVQSITSGDSDAEVVVVLHHASLPRTFRIRALAQNVDEYPDENSFVLFTDDDHTPKEVSDAIETIQNYLLGLSVYEMVTEISKQFNNILDRAQTKPVPAKPPSSKDEDEVAPEDDFSGDSDASCEADGEIFGLPSSPIPARSRLTPLRERAPWQARIKQDLRQVIRSGFKVGILEDFSAGSDNGMVSISIRINKLSLSEEAKSAWDVEDSDYVVLLVRFRPTNTTLESILRQPANLSGADFRVGRCKRYKPSLQSALRAFSESGSLDRLSSQQPDGDQFMKLFISNSLDQYLKDDFVSLVKLRETHGFSWEEANENRILRTGAEIPKSPDDDISREPATFDRPAGVNSTASFDHPILADDHLADKDCPGGRSFLLIAMQFTMRYFVKCTEFCLRCHRRVDSGFEALRPFVCSTPLCLYQYMSLGFGPNIEHEILTEPYVVDLLVSLCYAAVSGPPAALEHARSMGDTKSTAPSKHLFAIREFPAGLRLQVPDVSSAGTTMALAPKGQSRLYFDGTSLKHKDRDIRSNNWFVYRPRSNIIYHHAIIVNVFKNSFTFKDVCKSSYPVVAPVEWSTVSNAPSASEPSTTTIPYANMMLSKVDVYFYDTGFDSLDPGNQALSIRMILDTLPPISEIEEYLKSNIQSSFKSMRHVSTAAASLLQWIVSSNRSCISLVDRCPEQSKSPTQPATAPTAPTAPAAPTGRGRNRESERIPGMEGWIQFRFAQGSPDKEQRFKRALQEVAARKKEKLAQNPTIFAWHGSMIYNWHSIIRSGLDFKDVRCGRSYGDGVYFSPRLTASVSYSYRGVGKTWPNSVLKLTACISLNEIINAPEEFVSTNPHYVVSQLDWHQCRYLFVSSSPKGQQPKPTQGGTASMTAPSQETSGFHKQAAGLEIFGENGRRLEIPLSAIPPRTIGRGATPSSTVAKRSIQVVDDETASDEDSEDTKFIYSGDELDEATGPPLKKSDSRASPDRSATKVTTFKPGTLDLSSVLRLDPPTFANESATKGLARELKSLQDIQSKTPLHELGWFIDFDQISNLFQWIVELHSFDPSLPLATDMSKAKISSIVLEFRFGEDFPMSPPFVRVIRPRFLPFAKGGGGHVTAGGALCMELLTNSGWSPANSMESVLLQVRMAICSTDPKPARLRNPGKKPAGTGEGDYGISEAVDAFLRAANVHGWKVPHNLKKTALGV